MECRFYRSLYKKRHSTNFWQNISKTNPSKLSI